MRLDFAVARGVLLLPSQMVIIKESIVGYNNNLRKVTDDMKLGVNSDVNQGTKKAALRNLDGRPPKTNPPNSHPSNPIHKQAIQAQGLLRKNHNTLRHPQIHQQTRQHHTLSHRQTPSTTIHRLY